MSKNHPINPTTCNTSDLLNSIAQFVTENPMWHEDDDATARLATAYGILRNLCDPTEVTDEEFEFVMGIHNTLLERTEQE
jgi:hypothetical protein